MHGQGSLEHPPPLTCSRGGELGKKEGKSPAAAIHSDRPISLGLGIRTRPEGAKAKEDEATGHGVISGDWGPAGRGVARN